MKFANRLNNVLCKLTEPEYYLNDWLCRQDNNNKYTSTLQNDDGAKVSADFVLSGSKIVEQAENGFQFWWLSTGFAQLDTEAASDELVSCIARGCHDSVKLI